MRINFYGLWFETSIEDDKLKLTIANVHCHKEDTEESISLDKQQLKTLIFVLQQELEEMGQ